MRVLVAPDKFAGTLTSREAAQAIAAGWARRAPADELDLAPMSDGGPGFVEVLTGALGGEVLAVAVAGPAGGTAPATLLVDRGAGTAYVEAAQACGRHLGPPDPEHATTRGVGELLVAALDTGARRIVVGLGGTGTNDGGAGLLAALGATAEPANALVGGPTGLADLERADLEPARTRLRDVELVAATDVDNVLLGIAGATASYGPQKGLALERVGPVDEALARLARATDRRLALQPGAGAAGGLGFALLLLGATRRPGVEVVAEALRLPQRAGAADLVLTGEGCFDFTSRSGKVPAGVASVAQAAARPCVMLAGSVLVGARETRALGLDGAYGMVDLVGERASYDDPAGSLAALAERAARSWSTA